MNLVLGHPSGEARQVPRQGGGAGGGVAAPHLEEATGGAGRGKGQI